MVLDHMIRVLTYNIRKGKGGFRGAIDTTVIASSLAARSPDLVLCQEVFHSKVLGHVHQSADLASGLELESVYEPNAVYRRGHHGNATMSRFGVRASFNRNLSTNPFEKRGILYALVEDTGSPIHVFNTHLGLNRRQRRCQIENIGAILEEICCDGSPIILAGDFNDWTGRLDRHVRDRCGLKSVLDGMDRRVRRTFPSVFPIFNLDRIYYRDLDLLDVRILARPPWDRLSDHLPIEADFARPQPPAPPAAGR